MKNSILIILFFFHFSLLSQLTISGIVTDQNSGEKLLFASVYNEKSGIGTVTNEYGFFSLTVPMDTAKITLSYLGYIPNTIVVHKGNINELNFTLRKASTEVNTVTINVSRTPQEEIHNSTQMSAVKIPIKDIKYIPSIGGESDVIKVIQLMPGVQKGGEGGTGLYVRGGDVDQNLVLLDEAPVYNIGHLFGFFSVFNHFRQIF